MSHGIRRKIAAAGVSAVMAGGLLFGISSTAETTPAAEAAPAAVSTAVVLTSATTTVAPSTAIVQPSWDNDWNWKHKKRCKRVWHRASWFWWHNHRSWKRGWWSCRWW